MDYEVERELRGLKADKLMTQRAISSEQDRWARMLKGSLGKDMDDVLSGKKVVKLTNREIFRYKWRRLKNKLLKLFKKENDQRNYIEQY